MSEPLLKVEALEAGYGEVQVLWGVSLAAMRGHLTAHRRRQRRRQDHDAARRCRDHRAVARPRPVRWRGRDAAVDPRKSRTRLRAGARRPPIIHHHDGRRESRTRRLPEARARRATPSVSIRYLRCSRGSPNAQHQFAGTLSGGEQQMVAIARGLMSNPDILIIDEMSLGLAPVLVYQLFHTLKKLKDAGLTILLVEQNVHLALAVADYAYVIAEGKLFTEGEPKKLSTMPEIRKAYLGL